MTTRITARSEDAWPDFELYGTQVGVLRGPWRTFDSLTDPAAKAS